MKKLIIITLAVFCACVSLSAKKKSTAPVLKTSIDSVSYVLGNRYGSIVKKDLEKIGEDTTLNTKLVRQILNSTLDGDTSVISASKADSLLQDFLTSLAERHATKIRKKNTAYLDSVAKHDKAVQTTASGLMYKIVREGTGVSPKSTDMVEVHYEGKLIDGTVFDSSYKRGEPAKFQLDRVIAGWTEGLQLMKEGGEAILYIPYNLGYGEHGVGQDIPPYAALIFRVELLSVGK